MMITFSQFICKEKSVSQIHVNLLLVFSMKLSWLITKLQTGCPPHQDEIHFYLTSTLNRWPNLEYALIITDGQTTSFFMGIFLCLIRHVFELILNYSDKNDPP